jgi:hypothetical protein
MPSCAATASETAAGSDAARTARRAHHRCESAMPGDVRTGGGRHPCRPPGAREAGRPARSFRAKPRLRHSARNADASRSGTGFASASEASTSDLADRGTSLPEQDARTADRGNPRRFHRSAKWTKAMEGFVHGQLGMVAVFEQRIPEMHREECCCRRCPACRETCRRLGRPLPRPPHAQESPCWHHASPAARPLPR